MITDAVVQEALDDILIRAMFSPDRTIADYAKRRFLSSHPEPAIREPTHCSECFKGCPKCQRS